MTGQCYELETVRTFTASRGDERREMAIYRKSTDGSLWLHDVTGDLNCDSLTEIEDESDTAIADAIGVNEFEITKETP